MHLTFRWKLLLSHVGLAVAVGLLVIAVLDRSLRDDLRAELEARLVQQALGSASWVGAGRHPERLAERLSRVVGARVSIFDRDGKSLGDSSPSAVEQEPAALPEIAAARAGQVGRASRRAGQETMLHVAVTAGEGQILRLSAPLSEIGRAHV